MQKTTPTAIRAKESTMNTALGEKIVAGWAYDAFSMPTFRVHQTDYPEIEAEGRTPAEACSRLIAPLVEAIDFASETWRRQPLGLALVDARGIGHAFTDGARREPKLAPHPSFWHAQGCQPAAGGRNHRRGDHRWNASEAS
jgi:hypothetical protein